MPRRVLPQHFKRNGLPKKKYTPKQAEKAAKQYKQQAYYCNFCGWWHTGSRI